jgi:predicted transcriptional regulator
MLVRLEAKGVLRHEMDGARYIYSATTSPTAAKRAALKQYLGVFFKGSAGELVTALLRQERWTDAELDRLRGEIDRIRRERQKP